MLQILQNKSTASSEQNLFQQKFQLISKFRTITNNKTNQNIHLNKNLP